MKKTLGLNFLSFIFLHLLMQGYVNGQETAGYAPPGTSILYSPVTLSVIENDHDTTAYLDLDGDGTDDVRIWLIKGNTPSDAPNMAIFLALGNTFSFCNVSNQPVSLALYSFGDTLCIGDNAWGTDSFYTAGCYGGWNCIQDESPVIDKYIAYKKNSTGETGWLKVSMSLYANVDQIPVTFTISEMLVLFLESNVNEQLNSIYLDIMPNPTFDGLFSVRSNFHMEFIDIFNSSGVFICTYNNTNSQCKLPDDKGLYIIRTRDSKGQSKTQKIIRL